MQMEKEVMNMPIKQSQYQKKIGPVNKAWF